MASPDWQQEVLPPEYGADVSPSLPAAYVRVSDNGLGVIQANFWSYLGQDRCPWSLHRRSWERCAGVATWLGQRRITNMRDPTTYSHLHQTISECEGWFSSRISCHRIGPLYRQNMVGQNGRVCSGRIWRSFATGQTVQGHEGYPIWHSTEHLIFLRYPRVV